jgi:hypothetical protein
LLDRFAQTFEGTRVAFDQGDRLGPARRSLEPEHAGAREQVEAVQAGQVLAQPVEQTFADGIRCGTEAGHRRHRKKAAAPLAADDAYA